MYFSKYHEDVDIVPMVRFAEDDRVNGDFDSRGSHKVRRTY